MKDGLNIIERNFFRLLRAGAFEEVQTIEPMSAWKWQQLYHLAMQHGVAAIAYDGITRCSDQFFMQLTDEQRALWEEATKQTEQANIKVNIALSELITIYTKEQVRPILILGQSLGTHLSTATAPNMSGIHRIPTGIDIFFPFGPQATKANLWAKTNGQNISTPSKYAMQYEWKGVKISNMHALHFLTNQAHNRTLQALTEEEIRMGRSNYAVINGTKAETPPHTVQLLLILTDIARQIINNGLQLQQFIDLGLFLRKEGHKVDYVKLQENINKLQLTRMANLAGLLLLRYFNFTAEEIPFLTADDTEDQLKQLNGLLDTSSTENSEEWFFSQGKNDIFVHANNSKAMLGQMRHTARYFSYYPTETITNMLAVFAHSLSKIEE